MIFPGEKSEKCVDLNGGTRLFFDKAYFSVPISAYGFSFSKIPPCFWLCITHTIQLYGIFPYIWPIEIYMVHVAKYTVRPMGCYG